MLVIVPDFPPSINGLGDYAHLLANQLRIKDASLKIDFLVAGNSEYSFNELDGFKVYTLSEKKSSVLYFLLQNIDPKLIHLHYVGYGYEKRGAPVWLYLGLLKWKQKKGNILITTFHELFATSKILWTSSFWNQWLQKMICKKIFLLSKCVVTNRESFRKDLVKFSPFIDIYVYPVFSNFGEMKECQNMELMGKGLIVLGSCEKRFVIYEKYQKELSIIFQKYSIERIVDIGPKISKLPPLKLPLIELGVLTANDISNLLKKNTFGIIAGHNTCDYAKSGVFAAYAAHGMIVFALDKNLSKIEDGIILNQHYITINSLNVNINKVGKSVFEWYNIHSLDKQAFLYASLFNF